MLFRTFGNHRGTGENGEGREESGEEERDERRQKRQAGSWVKKTQRYGEMAIA